MSPRDHLIEELMLQISDIKESAAAERTAKEFLARQNELLSMQLIEVTSDLEKQRESNKTLSETTMTQAKTDRSDPPEPRTSHSDRRRIQRRNACESLVG